LTYSYNNYRVQEVLGRINRLRSLLHRESIENATTNNSIVACICCRGNVFTKPLLSNEREIRHRLMGGIYEVHR
jgi:hypothetical protein